jgi:hypothetical protein
MRNLVDDVRDLRRGRIIAADVEEVPSGIDTFCRTCRAAPGMRCVHGRAGGTGRTRGNHPAREPLLNL